MNAKSNQLSVTAALLIVLYILTGTLPNFKAIDILAPQWIYLTSVNILSVIFIYFNKNKLIEYLGPLFSSMYFRLYSLYIVWAAISYLFALNKAETLINFPRYFNVYVGIINTVALLYCIKKPSLLISTVFFVFVTAEVLLYFNQFSEQVASGSFNALLLKGFSGNKNIAAASMAIKIPFLLFFYQRTKRELFRFGILVLLSLIYLALTIIYARAALLSSTAIVLLFTFYQMFLFFKKLIPLDKMMIHLASVLVPFIFAFYGSKVLSSIYNTKSYSDRVQSIAFNREASSGRFNYWESAIQSFLDNPFLGSGLGNFKITSISYGAEYIKGYTVPYHAHNDFIHTATELGIIGFVCYLGIFIFLLLCLIKLFIKYLNDQKKLLIMSTLLLSLMTYGIDAFFNFPVARPLMQSSLILICGLILNIYFRENEFSSPVKPLIFNSYFIILFVILVPSLWLTINQYNAMVQQGRLLYEFNNAKYNYTLAELDEISNDFPNLTETAMPIKAMKARYFYNNGKKEEAISLLHQSMKDNPYIRFPESLLAQFYLNEKKLDSAYYYSKIAFDNLPNNMPHYDVYMKSMVAKRDIQGINKAFERHLEVGISSETAWMIYLRSLAQTRSLGDAEAMSKASEAFKLFPNSENIFFLYRVLTYGQQSITQADQLSKEAEALYLEQNFIKAAEKYKEAMNLDGLNKNHALNTGISYYQSNKFESAISFFNIALSSKRGNIAEKALRFKGLSLAEMDENSKACAVFARLKNLYPKRMYQQEFQKYCYNK